MASNDLISGDEYLISERRTRRRNGRTVTSSRNRVAGLEVVIRRFAATAESPQSSQRPFVLVHGIGVSSRYFHPLAAELAKSGAVFLIDLPGYGSSPNPKRRVSIEEHANALGSFLEREGIVDPVLVGHSMGTQVVSRLAVDHPQITDRLVLLAPTTNPPDRSLATQARHLAVDMLHESAAVNVIVSTDYLFRCGVPYFLSQAPNLLDDHLEERLPSLSAKTLVVRGDRDPIVPREWAERVTALIPLGSFKQVVGPHVIMHSDPLRTAALIVEHARP